MAKTNTVTETANVRPSLLSLTRENLNPAFARKGQILSRVANITTKEIKRGDVTRRAIETEAWKKLSVADQNAVNLCAAFESLKKAESAFIAALASFQQSGGKLAE